MHLIEWYLEAIKNWPVNKSFTTKECLEWDKDFTVKLYQVLEHYKRGCTLLTRP